MSSDSCPDSLYDDDHHRDIMLLSYGDSSDLRYDWTMCTHVCHGAQPPPKWLLILVGAATTSYLWYLDFYADRTNEWPIDD